MNPGTDKTIPNTSILSVSLGPPGQPIAKRERQYQSSPSPAAERAGAMAILARSGHC